MANSSGHGTQTSVRNTDIDTAAVIDWYRTNMRQLPWRAAGTSAWGIVVSEFMLQQTPVARVLKPWSEWMTRWPKPSDLASASPGEAVRAWGKLGYPRRAMRLHQCAVAIATEHNDIVPDDVETLLSLPGIGAYTSRAIACFAYGQRVPVVDTNVRRVIDRAEFATDTARPANRQDFANAEALLPTEQVDAAIFSAGLMEFGATVCTARNPRCGECPLPKCAWVQAGRPISNAVPRTQAYAGTDRHVRGLLLDVLRGSGSPVDRAALDIVWLDNPGQRQRALDSLLVDGLIEQTASGLFALCGEA